MSSYRRGRSRSRSPSPSHRRRQDSRDRDSHRDRGQGRDGRDDRDYNRGRPRDYSRERSRERSKERDSRPRQDRDHTRRDDRSRPTNNANSGSGNQQGNNQNHNHNNNHHNNNQGRGGGRHHGNFKRKMKDDGPLRPVTYINTSLKPAEDTAAKQSAAMNSDLPQLIDEAMPGDDDDEVDLSTMMELEDFDLDASLKKQQKAEEETRRQAEERRKRLEDIKAKYQQPPQPPQPASNVDAVEAVKSNGSEDVAVKVVDVEEDLVAEGDMDLAKASASDLPQEGNNNDKEQDNNVEQNEGDQLAREKLALESADQGNKGAFDMFSDSPSDLEKIAQLPNAKLGKRAFREALLDGENPHLQSNWDDGEGYYKPTIGEMVGNRFQILGIVGKGVFSSVLKCLDSQDPEGKSTVAVKMIRNNDTMRKAAEKERQILMQLNEHDKNNKRFCIRLISHLEYRHHIALVFEYQSMNLRETLKKFGKDVGINISAIRIYGRQLFVALRYLMELKIVHADIKLDNILCSEDLKTVKLCDFGSAFHEYDTDNDPTPYLVSRFYRAPEIIMGQQCE